MTAHVAVLIPADLALPVRQVSYAGLTELQHLVDGWIERAAVPQIPELALWCNEDGLSRMLPANHRATQLWRSLVHARTSDRMLLVGDVVLACVDLATGDDADLTEPGSWVTVAEQLVGAS